MGGQGWKQRNTRKCHEIKRISKILQHPKINPGSAPDSYYLQDAQIQKHPFISVLQNIEAVGRRCS